MKIAFHGGKCCGIKHIHGMGYSPNSLAEALEGHRPSAADQYGHDVNSGFNFFPDPAPEETYEGRLDRYIKYLDAVRPHGIIEIVLADDENDEDDQQQARWKPLLLERGFVVVSDCYNSNSGNRIFVYHRKTDKE